jgi:hypothetical protein
VRNNFSPGHGSGNGQVADTATGPAVDSSPAAAEPDREGRRRAQAEARASRAAARAAARAIPPQRSEDLAHLSLDGLRAYRTALAAEEDRVSYWRRILQARLDTVRAVDGARAADPAAVAPALTPERMTRGRTALVTIVPQDDIPPLPDLARLWGQLSDNKSDAEQAELMTALERAEEQLSTYRAALHARMASASSELIARYRDDPHACFSALPLSPNVNR